MKELRMIKKYPLATAGNVVPPLPYCFAGAEAAAMLNGCPVCQDTDVRSPFVCLSGNMLLAASPKAAQDALTNLAFNLFLEQYKKKSNGRSPLLKLGLIHNDTDECDLQASLVSREIADALSQSGKLRIAGGRLHSKDVGTAKQLSGASTENKCETAPLLLAGMLMSNRDKSDKNIYDTTALSVQITDMETEKNIWRISTSFWNKAYKSSYMKINITGKEH